MKKITLLLIGLLSITFIAIGQIGEYTGPKTGPFFKLHQLETAQYRIIAKQESLVRKQNLMETNILNAGSSLVDFHTQYKKGNRFYFVGLGLSVLSSVLFLNGVGIFIPLTVMIGGTFLTTVGYVITINSHKHIRRAGKYLE